MGVLRALLHVCRADGVINPDELAVLRRCAGELGVSDLDEEMLLLEDELRPDGLAGLLRGAGNAAARAGFVEAARAVSMADGEIDEEESRCIDEYARALGVSTN